MAANTAIVVGTRPDTLEAAEAGVPAFYTDLDEAIVKAREGGALQMF